MTSPLAAHREELIAAVSSADRIALLLDFDGTLAPLVQRPELAQLPPRTRAVLTTLHADPRVTLAFISGRALADLRSRVGLDAIYAGNHGLEIEGPGLDFPGPMVPGVDLSRAQAALRTIAAQLTERLASIPGAQVEDKAASLSIHYRNVATSQIPLVADAVASVTDTFTDGIALHEGKLVIEIRPRVDWHKGKAAEWILAQLPPPPPLAIAAGDDRTDEDIFRCLPEAISIKVGDGPTSARFRARDPEEVHELLMLVLETL